MTVKRGSIGVSWTTAAIRGVAVVALASNLASAQSAPVITGDTHVDKLLSQMTLAEKLTLIHDGPEGPKSHQGQAGYIGGLPRLGVPALRLADGPPGVLTRHPSQAETATTGVATTFDVRLAEANGVVIGREARALAIDVALQPFINLNRDLAFKRAYNTFGEDPLLTSPMAAARYAGSSPPHVMAMAKHFIGFDAPGSDVWIDDRTLHQAYLFGPGDRWCILF